MPLLCDFNVVPFHGKLEKSDYVVRHKLSRDRPTRERGKLLTTAGDILRCLNRCEFICAALSLNGHDELLAISIDADIDFVNLNLAHVLELSYGDDSEASKS